MPVPKTNVIQDAQGNKFDAAIIAQGLVKV